MTPSTEASPADAGTATTVGAPADNKPDDEHGSGSGSDADDDSGPKPSTSELPSSPATSMGRNGLGNTAPAMGPAWRGSPGDLRAACVLGPYSSSPRRCTMTTGQLAR